MDDFQKDFEAKAEAFAKRTAPIYKELDWKWLGEYPTPARIERIILFELLPSVKHATRNWSKDWRESYQASTGGIVVTARTYEGSDQIEFNILFDISATAAKRPKMRI